jgi:hypothetical protein
LEPGEVVGTLARLAILCHYNFMTPRIHATKKSRGRPPKESEAVTVRIDAEGLRAIDDWRRGEDDLPGRPEAIRRLVQLSLKAHGK